MNGNGGAFGTFQERILGQAIQNVPFCFVTAVTQSLTRYKLKSQLVAVTARTHRLKDDTVTLFPSIASSLVVAILGGLKYM